MMLPLHMTPTCVIYQKIDGSDYVNGDKHEDQIGNSGMDELDKWANHRDCKDN